MQSAAAVIATPSTAARDETVSLSVRALIAHDWLVQYGGSERAVEQIRRVLPNSSVVTTVCRDHGLPAAFDGAHTTFLQRIPGATSHHQWLLPLMPIAWRAVGIVEDVDLVVSSSHACAKAIRVAPGIPHVCYCYTPMRYAWDFAAERGRVAAPLRPAAAALMAAFRRWDQRTTDGVTHFVAISSTVAERIRRSYGRTATVIHPPVRTDYFTPSPAERQFFLYVGRLVGYKRPDLVVEAFRGQRNRLVVVGDGPALPSLRATASGNVSFLGAVSDDRLRDLYREATALVHVADEDFGIAMAEAQACGTPVIGLRRGGARDIVVDGLTGWLVDQQSVPALRAAIDLASTQRVDHGEISRRAARFSTERFQLNFSEFVREAIRRG